MITRILVPKHDVNCLYIIEGIIIIFWNFGCKKQFSSLYILEGEIKNNNLANFGCKKVF